MIARTWRGRATKDNAAAYEKHFTTTVAQNLAGIEGNIGAFLLRRTVQGEIEFLAVTLWDSIDTIRQFAGHDVEVAHIEPEGGAALSTFDERASNFEVIFSTVERSKK